MKAAIALLAVLIPAAAMNQTEPATCDGVPRPALPVDYVFDPNAVKYSGPAALEGAPQTQWPVEAHAIEVDGGVRYRFSYVGELRVSEDWTKTEELAMAPTDPPACWAWQWRELAP